MADDAGDDLGRPAETVRDKILTLYEADVSHSDRPPVVDGGTDADRRQVLELHHRFMAANDTLDNDALRKIWSSNPDCVFFNSNGHTYVGLDDWLRIWDHYRPRVRLLRPYKAGSLTIIIRGDMAVILSDRVARYFDWVAEEPVPDLFTWPYVRHTQVCLREHGEWKIIHAHFSSMAEGPRPDRRGGPGTA